MTNKIFHCFDCFVLTLKICQEHKHENNTCLKCCKIDRDSHKMSYKVILGLNSYPF